MMKKGNIHALLALAALIVVGLSVAFVITDTSSPTGYAPTPGPTGFVGFGLATEECSNDNDCSQDYCEEDDFVKCIQGSCQCISPCDEGGSCTFSQSDCGTTGTCYPNSVFNAPTAFGIATASGGCDCNNDGCTEGRSCDVFTNSNGQAVDVCGPNGFCEIDDTGESSGGEGTCVCGNKPCQFLDADGFEGQKDQCPGTVSCEPGNNCNSNADCGGVGVGSCVNGNCECHCQAWLPCQSNSDCGTFGQSGEDAYGDCVEGPDGSLECMCTDTLGCAPQDCVPGKTPCSGRSKDCAGRGQSACETLNGEGGVCSSCGNDCSFEESSGEDSFDVDQTVCNDLNQQMGDECTFSNGENPACDCKNIPDRFCNLTWDVTDGQGQSGTVADI